MGTSKCRAVRAECHDARLPQAELTGPQDEHEPHGRYRPDHRSNEEGQDKVVCRTAGTQNMATDQNWAISGMFAGRKPSALSADFARETGEPAASDWPNSPWGLNNKTSTTNPNRANLIEIGDIVGSDAA